MADHVRFGLDQAELTLDSAAVKCEELCFPGHQAAALFLPKLSSAVVTMSWPIVEQQNQLLY